MRPLAQHQFETLVSAIYGASLDPDLWPDFEAKLDTALDSVYLVFYGHDLRANISFDTITSKFSKEEEARYHAHYAAINPYPPAMLKSPLARIRNSETWVRKDALMRTEFYNDFLRPNEDIGAAAGGVLFNDDDRLLIFGGHVRMREQETGIPLLEKNLNPLVPHIRNAFEIQRRLLRARLRANASARALDAIDTPVFILTRSGAAVYRNPAAETVLSQGQPLYLDRLNRLRARTRAADRAITAGLAELVSGDPLRVRAHRVVLRGASGQPLPALLSPYDAETRDRAFGAFLESGTDPAAILTLGPGQSAPAPLHEQLGHSFGLTPAEAKLAVALSRGETPKTYAAIKERSIHTIRNQLKSAFTKTGTHRQSELIALVLRMTDNGTP